MGFPILTVWYEEIDSTCFRLQNDCLINGRLVIGVNRDIIIDNDWTNVLQNLRKK